jgi:hypothetical protein
MTLLFLRLDLDPLAVGPRGSRRLSGPVLAIQLFGRKISVFHDDFNKRTKI